MRNRRKIPYLEARGGPNKPGPARAEGGETSVNELSTELIVRAEVLVDKGGELASRLATAVGLHAVPVEGMVVRLGGIVEEGLVLA